MELSHGAWRLPEAKAVCIALRVAADHGNEGVKHAAQEQQHLAESEPEFYDLFRQDPIVQQAVTNQLHQTTLQTSYKQSLAERARLLVEVRTYLARSRRLSALRS